MTAWNIIFVLDISNSMNVKDVFYNNHQVSRLTLAKKIIENNIKKLNNKYWLVIFSDSFNYFIPPTYDKINFLNYLKSLNTNFLDWWQTNLKALSSWLNNYLWKLDQIIFLSDFDFKSLNLNINNYTYFIWIWKEINWTVKNKYWETLFKNWKVLLSKLNKNILIKLSKKYWEYYVINHYNKWQTLKFLSKLNNKNYLEKKDKINIKLIIWFWLILISL